MELRNPIPLPLADLVPPAERFAYASVLHGPAHVSRVLVHAFLLVERTGFREEAPRLWGAVYVHDLVRFHDGVARDHGKRAAALLGTDEGLAAHLARGGVTGEDHEAIRTAVTHYSVPWEIAKDHPHRRLTALLKDADGLERVRLKDLDRRYLRFPETPTQIPFAQRLYRRSRDLPPGDLEALWPVAEELAAELL